MDFEYPSNKGFTIYSKSGCPNCNKAKHLLKDNNLNFNIINCDEYIIEEKENFLYFIKKLSQRESKEFPIIFHDGEFIGGYKNVKEYVEKIFLSFEDNLDF